MKDYKNSIRISGEVDFHILSDECQSINSFKFGDLVWKPNYYSKNKLNIPIISVKHQHIIPYEYNTEYYQSGPALAGIGIITWKNHEKILLMFEEFPNNIQLIFMQYYKAFNEAIEGITANEVLDADIDSYVYDQLVSILEQYPFNDYYDDIDYIKAFRELTDYLADNDWV